MKQLPYGENCDQQSLRVKRGFHNDISTSISHNGSEGAYIFVPRGCTRFGRSAPRITTNRDQFSEHAQSTLFVFWHIFRILAAYQICQN